MGISAPKYVYKIITPTGIKTVNSPSKMHVCGRMWRLDGSAAAVCYFFDNPAERRVVLLEVLERLCVELGTGCHSGDALVEGFALDVLHGNEGDLVVFTQLENGAEAGVIEMRGYTCFAEESLPSFL